MRENSVELRSVGVCSGRNKSQTLAKALGYDVDIDASWLPYVSYIEQHWPGKGDPADFLSLVAEVVTFLGRDDEPVIRTLLRA